MTQSLYISDKERAFLESKGYNLDICMTNHFKIINGIFYYGYVFSDIVTDNIRDILTNYRS